MGCAGDSNPMAIYLDPVSKEYTVYKLRGTRPPALACKQAHLVSYSHEYLGGGATIYEPASETSLRVERGPIFLVGWQIEAPPPRY